MDKKIAPFIIQDKMISPEIKYNFEGKSSKKISSRKIALLIAATMALTSIFPITANSFKSYIFDKNEYDKGLKMAEDKGYVDSFNYSVQRKEINEGVYDPAWIFFPYVILYATGQ